MIGLPVLKSVGPENLDLPRGRTEQRMEIGLKGLLIVLNFYVKKCRRH